MPVLPFCETYTLSDAVEQIGRRLYGETWTGLEYMSQPGKSPEEIANERKPLEEELSTAETEIREIDAAIRKTVNAEENQRLAIQYRRLEARASRLRATLNLEYPLNDTVRDSYSAHVRGKTATETLLQAIKEFRLKVHDGRGRELNHFVWSDPRFSYCLDLSIAVNPRISGEPRRQAARIDRDQLKNWLATLKPIVEAKHERSVEERLTEFLRQHVADARGGPRKTKDALREEALAQIAGTTGRMFDRVWPNIVPQKWRRAGAPRKARISD